MIYFFIMLAVYFLSIIAVYYVARFMYLTNNSKGPIPPIYWVIPIINTALVVIGFMYSVKDIPIAGTNYWNKRWDKLKDKRKVQ